MCCIKWKIKKIQSKWNTNASALDYGEQHGGVAGIFELVWFDVTKKMFYVKPLELVTV